MKSYSKVSSYRALIPVRLFSFFTACFNSFYLSDFYVPLICGTELALLDVALSKDKPDQVVSIRVPKNEYPSSAPKKLQYDEFFPFLTLAKNGTYRASFVAPLSCLKDIPDDEVVRSSLCRIISRVYFYGQPDARVNVFYDYALQLLQDKSRLVRMTSAVIWPSYSKLGTSAVGTFLHVRFEFSFFFQSSHYFM